MNTLLVDIGNTRVKWAALANDKLGKARALPHEGDAASMRTLVRGAPDRVERVVAVSVAGEQFARALRAAVRARFGVAVEFLGSTRKAGGVRNGYKDVWRLGADRWVGAIGAFHLARGRAVIVANVGTALTIDLVTAEGQHRGGAIVPGPATMIDSLLAGTHGIRRRAAGARASTKTLFADNTASALAAGAEFAAAAFIDRAVAEARRELKATPLLILSGGGADALRRRLASKAQVVPDLVLRGLAACARA